MQVPHETPSPDELQILGAAVVAFDDGREFAVDVEPRKVIAEVVQKPRVACAGGPGEGLSPREIEGNAQVRMRIMSQRELGGIGNGVIDAAVRHAVQQCLGIGTGILHPHEIRQQVTR